MNYVNKPYGTENVNVRTTIKSKFSIYKLNRCALGIFIDAYSSDLSRTVNTRLICFGFLWTFNN